jgi:hypothetical protein
MPTQDPENPIEQFSGDMENFNLWRYGTFYDTFLKTYYNQGVIISVIILRNFAALKCNIALQFNVMQPKFKKCSRNSRSRNSSNVATTSPANGVPIISKKIDILR